jgi:LysR family hydrogen peroxide-inducible transcriptional activator
MTLTQLEYILALQKAKNFGAAAALCFVTQPSLSAQIQKLEEELGVVLFDRSRSPVMPTEVGRNVLEQARLILDGSQRLFDVAMVWKKEAKGELRLGIISTLSPYLVPLFLKEFVKKYPAVQVVLYEDKTQNLVRAIEEGDMDVAILSPPGKASCQLVGKPLFYEPFVVYAHPGQPILEKKEIRYSDLPLEELLILDDTHCLRDQVIQICGSRTQKRKAYLAEIKSGGLQTLIGLVNSGKGFTLLPYLAALNMTESQRRQQVRFFAKPVPVRKISLIFHRARLKRPLVEALHQEILSCLPDGIFTSLKTGLKTVNPGEQHFLI